MSLEFVSIFLEFIIFILLLIVAIKKKKKYGWFLSATFLIYVFYDTTKLIGWKFPYIILELLFFIATVSALIGVWMIYKKR